VTARRGVEAGRSETATPPDLSDVRFLVLAGGASTRFWPVDKVFADPTGSGRTLLQQTFDRVACRGPGADPLARFARADRFFVVTGGERAAVTRDHLGLDPGQVLAEPARRGTWPAILWALAELRARGDAGDTVVAVLTADHLIGNLEVFRRTILDAVSRARRGGIVTIGIDPGDDPEAWTSFGAIRAERDAGNGPVPVARFEEKPDDERASEMIREGGWSWNSGMFVFRIDTAERSLSRFQPAMHATYAEVRDALGARDRPGAIRSFETFESRIPHPGDPERFVDNSIDFAVVTPMVADAAAPGGGADRVFLLPARFPWTDLGSWDALRAVLPRDARGNVVVGDVRALDVRDSILVAEPGRRIEARGLRGAVVVVSADGRVLATRVDLARRIKPLVGLMRSAPRTLCALDCRDCAARVCTDLEGAAIALFGLASVKAEHRGDRVVVEKASDGSPLASLARDPCPLRPRLVSYAWGGRGLGERLGIDPGDPRRPVAEAWLTSTRPEGPAFLEGSGSRLRDLVESCPEVLGDPPKTELPVFVKLLSTRFPDRVHLGLDPRAPERLGARSPAEMRARFRSLAREDAHLLRSVRSSVADLRGEALERFLAAYESWATDQALIDFDDPERDRPFAAQVEALRGAPDPDLMASLAKLRSLRAVLTSAFAGYDLRREVGTLLLCPSGTPHAIFGLSHQVHPPARSPRAADDRPKSEVWIPFEADGELWIAEVQQSSNTTRSFLDLWTPFVAAESGPLFRKGDPRAGLTAADLDAALADVAFETHDPDARRRKPVAVLPPSGSRSVRWLRLLDEPESWPWFSVYRLELDPPAGGEAVFASALPPGSSEQLVVLSGGARLSAGDRHARLSPGAPAFLPATLEERRYRLASREPAVVLVVGRPGTRPDTRPGTRPG